MEEQQSQAVATAAPARTRLTPAQAETLRRKEGLLLARKHTLQQLEAARKPLHRKVLEDALADLEARLARLD